MLSLMTTRYQSVFDESGALIRGHFKLSSGLHSDVYVEKFRIMGRASEINKRSYLFFGGRPRLTESSNPEVKIADGLISSAFARVAAVLTLGLDQPSSRALMVATETAT